MTKEEAHKILCRNILPCLIGEWREAISIATKALEAEPHWIPVEQELPQKNGAYLVTAEGFPVSIKFYSADSYGWGEEWHRVITAWMPLPKAWRG